MTKKITSILIIWSIWADFASAQIPSTRSAQIQGSTLTEFTFNPESVNIKELDFTVPDIKENTNFVKLFTSNFFARNSKVGTGIYVNDSLTYVLSGDTIYNTLGDIVFSYETFDDSLIDEEGISTENLNYQCRNFYSDYLYLEYCNLLNNYYGLVGLKEKIHKGPRNLIHIIHRENDLVILKYQYHCRFLTVLMLKNKPQNRQSLQDVNFQVLELPDIQEIKSYEFEGNIKVLFLMPFAIEQYNVSANQLVFDKKLLSVDYEKPDFFFTSMAINNHQNKIAYAIRDAFGLDDHFFLRDRFQTLIYEVSLDLLNQNGIGIVGDNLYSRFHFDSIGWLNTWDFESQLEFFRAAHRVGYRVEWEKNGFSTKFAYELDAEGKLNRIPCPFKDTIPVTIFDLYDAYPPENIVNRNIKYSSPISAGVVKDLVYGADDQVLFAYSHQYPFSVKDGYIANWENMPHSHELMAIDIVTKKNIIRKLTDFTGPDYWDFQRKLQLQANGKVYVNSSEFLEEVENSSTIFKDDQIKTRKIDLKPIDPKENWEGNVREDETHPDFNHEFFVEGNYRYLPLKLSLFDTCSDGFWFLVNADTHYFDAFKIRVGQNNETMIYRNELLPKKNRVKLYAAPNQIHNVTILGLKNGIIQQSQTYQWMLPAQFINPKASFQLSDTVGCQWVGYQIKNSSFIYDKQKNWTFTWDFGEGKDSSVIIPPSNKIEIDGSMLKIYRQSGTYPIKMSINDGFCNDTFEAIQKVEILPAPRPGAKISPNIGCEPATFTISRKYQDDVDSVFYSIEKDKEYRLRCPNDCEMLTFEASLEKNQKEKERRFAIQSLLGTTGCITSDTAWFEILPSFHPTDTPYIKYATVEDLNQINIEFEELIKTKYYQLFNKNSLVGQTVDRFYTVSEKDIALDLNHFSIKGLNECDENSETSNLAKNIVLSGSTEPQSSFSTLVWTPYSHWKNGISRYEVLEIDADGGSSLVVVIDPKGELQYQDDEFMVHQSMSNRDIEKCYVIRAIENHTNFISESNKECVPYHPVFILPTAFSPNADAINEIYRPIAIGIVSYKIEIYNRWGQLIYSGNESQPGWDGKDAADGVYLVKIQGIDNQNFLHNYAGSVTLLR